MGFRDAISQNDLDNLKNTITAANNLAVKVKGVPAPILATTHWTANEKLKKLSEELKKIFQAELLTKGLKTLFPHLPTAPTKPPDTK